MSGVGLRVRVFVRGLQTKRIRGAFLGSDNDKNYYPPIPRNQGIRKNITFSFQEW